MHPPSYYPVNLLENEADMDWWRANLGQGQQLSSLLFASLGKLSSLKVKYPST